MLSTIYIKGFKTFARPVRMPLEGGVTAIVGPNGSGKSNITDAVLFALGEQSPGMLRAGAMGELIFSGSESLAAANVAEVTLVVDNSSGHVSLPYEEVSISRRVSRDGGTEYRINGVRSRLADVRSVAGEAGLGRHSILRQGAVDAIVSGGAEACRQALEEAAGLGVYRRRRLSASRRLEKADAQLEQSRQIEAEISEQLQRIEREAAAAREYREIEARFRELSLAHLFRLANRELDETRKRLDESRERVEELTRREEKLREEEQTLDRDLAYSERELRTLETTIENLEEGIEGLRNESLRIERSLFRLEAGRGDEDHRRESLSRLEAEKRRVETGLESLKQRLSRLESEHASNVEESDSKREESKRARKRGDEAERARSRLSAELEGKRARMSDLRSETEASVASPAELSGLEEALRRLENEGAGSSRRDPESPEAGVSAAARAISTLEAESNRRRGSLSAVVGRVESKVRSLRVSASPNGSGVRLFEVVRARPGFEAAVEAALGEFGTGVLAQDVSEGVRLLSETQRVAIRLDAERVQEYADFPGKPLLECVEVVDGRYAESVERLLGGIYVVESARTNHLTNGHVAVTRDGLRLTRTSVSLASQSGGFAREARLSASQQTLAEIESGPEKLLREIRDSLTAFSDRLESASDASRFTTSLAGRTRRARETLAREGRRRLAAAARTHENSARRAESLAALERDVSEGVEALSRTIEDLKESRRKLSATAAANDEAQNAAEDSRRELKRLRAAVAEGERRLAAISTRLERAHASSTESDGTPLLADRMKSISESLSGVCARKRGSLRLRRAELTEKHRHSSSRRNALSRDAAELGADLAAARANVERLEETLKREAASSSAASEEIREEWGATLKDAERESRRHQGDTEQERNRLARKLKRFGDVNLLSLSQETEMRQRHETIAAQRADAETASSELNRIIHSIDREIETRFSRTFRRVKGTFSEMVPRMMAGAVGALDLSDEGVEISLKLGRKGWRSLKVLSGGERSLLALSFLFSILLSRGESAGTFCILDEAEAALDDVNLARFISVVDSQRANGQFILVTHQKRTMAAADVLYGAVQDASGATSVVSKRIQGD